ncbi:hypothetical protein [Arenimonas fontis]|uniref:Beta-barrel assembly machine subunit BamC n=1 Tax=Arenimonas fontis TaxID=2608255 RepID=A0A5B2ZBX1_9GAMM|nr:hypothetical protein [Arenimonas fontis]KAA2285569.1 hypothetical protein F0415_02715 [Arenimonas fontis]
MTPTRSLARAALSAVLAAALVGTSGCSWLRSKFGTENAYQRSVQNRPLEVPPGLDTPSTAGGVAIPEVSASPRASAPVEGPVPGGPGAAATVPAMDSFTLEDSLASAWRRIGLALGKIEGVTVDERAQLLNSYSVRYQGQAFLVRAEQVGEAVRVVALGADGRPLSGGAAARLLGLLKARLG